MPPEKTEIDNACPSPDSIASAVSVRSVFYSDRSDADEDVPELKDKKTGSEIKADGSEIQGSLGINNATAAKVYHIRSMRAIFEDALMDYDELMEDVVPTTVATSVKVVMPEIFGVTCPTMASGGTGRWPNGYVCSAKNADGKMCSTGVNDIVTRTYPPQTLDIQSYRTNCPKCAHAMTATARCNSCFHVWGSSTSNLSHNVQDHHPSLTPFMKALRPSTHYEHFCKGSSRALLSILSAAILDLWNPTIQSADKHIFVIHHFGVKYRSLVEKILCIRQAVLQQECGMLCWDLEESELSAPKPWLVDDVSKKAVVAMPALKFTNGKTIKGRQIELPILSADGVLSAESDPVDETGDLWREFLRNLRSD